MIKLLSASDARLAKVNVFLRDDKTEYLGCDLTEGGPVTDREGVVRFYKDGVFHLIPIDLVKHIELYVDKDDQPTNQTK